MLEIGGGADACERVMRLRAAGLWFLFPFRLLRDLGIAH